MAIPVVAVGVITFISTVLLPRLVPLLSSLAVQVLVMAGFSFTVVQGLEVGFDFFVDYMETNLSRVPADIAGMMGLLGIDEAINAVLTGYIFAIGIKVLSGKKFVPSFGKGRS
ncbi:hypothetical protein BCT30_18050 [Enterovibrio norvegicus]|uniref:DUF2523 family protein n=1 Tax=Enterovibrio norvegicus TaxID=188144 RepID=UPI000C839772|nr:DUF2523 family protein [Enterovibrio norvegicus]MCC4798666.1 DUF2523 domain-containing protein [Enterovibrio norvegicus]PMI36905.1 hypothetical protein BCU46_01635 [Enterovibrio norvegicus]PMN49415.1 hypothetical protein BCT30_18050 [Enterovibrio norvegicus]